MSMYHTKPIAVEAMQLTWANWSDVCAFVGVPENGHGIDATLPDLRMAIYTNKGDWIAREGDWIIKADDGQFQLCKPDIFEKTYESAEVMA